MKPENLTTCSVCKIPCSCNMCGQDERAGREWLASDEAKTVSLLDGAEIGTIFALYERERLDRLAACDGVSSCCANRRADDCPLGR